MFQHSGQRRRFGASELRGSHPAKGRLCRLSQARTAVTARPRSGLPSQAAWRATVASEDRDPAAGSEFCKWFLSLVSI